MKKIYYERTNDYDMVVSVDEDNDVRYITETNEFPRSDENIEKFVAGIEDDSSWEDDIDYSDIEKMVESGDAEIIFEMEKEL